MSKIITRLSVGLVIVLLAAVLVVRFVIVPRTDATMNEVFAHEPYPVSEEAAAFHDTLIVADLHADTLLWARNPSRRHDFGHTDLPRFREGRVGLQVFTAVTKVPTGQNYEENTDTTDDITLLAMAQWWPIDTWTSIEARARFQARRLQKVARQDDGFTLVRTKADLARVLADRKTNPDAMGGILGLEGSHPLESDLAAIDRLYDEGYRVMGLQHFFDNELGDSLHGVTKAGLTPFGRDAVARMEQRHIVIDVAHSSRAVVREVLASTTRPVIISHTGVKSLCETPRNIDDELLRQIADGGGLIGIGFWDDVACDASPDGLAALIENAIDLFGIDAIALGSDFDGTVSAHFDVSELDALTDALLRRGLSRDQIRKVMGENQISFFQRWLPDDE